uniref:Odorant-binding protein n=1 Tax=Phenacoccus solenopsis TaxID=483260 RepID=A0A0U2WGN2_9HEMI|nr:odorant-binding protein [Phenacoccus solenopsis]
MKLLPVLLLLVGLLAAASSHHLHEALSDEDKQRHHQESEECIAESKLDPQILADMKAGKKPDPIPRELHCYAKCILKKEGVMKEDGSINEDRPGRSDAAKECEDKAKPASLAEADQCDTAGKIMGCYAKNHLIPKF